MGMCEPDTVIPSSVCGTGSIRGDTLMMHRAVSIESSPVCSFRPAHPLARPTHSHVGPVAMPILPHPCLAASSPVAVQRLPLLAKVHGWAADGNDDNVL